MSRPVAGDRRPPPPVPFDVRPWASRNAIEIPETTRCATCHQDVSFLVLDNRDMTWRCAACATPVDESPAEAWQD
jgi:hypothetical protein